MFSADGNTAYVAALGSGVVAAFDTADLEQGVVNRDLIPVGGGPTGIVLDEANDRMFVMNRFEGCHIFADMARLNIPAPRIGFSPLLALRLSFAQGL